MGNKHKVLLHVRRCCASSLAKGFYGEQSGPKTRALASEDDASCVSDQC